VLYWHEEITEKYFKDLNYLLDLILNDILILSELVVYFYSFW
jgi:hypothetical protein